MGDAGAPAAGATGSTLGAQIQPPAVTVPKGGGAMRGIGEKFGVNPVTGTGSLSIPIAVSPGRSGFGPQLTVSYDSGAGNGVFGFGWSLSLPAISRKTDKGLPRYDDEHESDVFLLSGAEDLVPVLVERNGNWVRASIPPRTLPDGSTWTIERYRPRIDGLFARIERWTNAHGETHWRSISRDNVTTVYGLTDESRITDPDDPERRRVFSWLICESYDDRGNAVLYRYAEENDDGVPTESAHERNRTTETRKVNRHLKRIKYGNVSPRQPGEDLTPRTDWLFEVVLDYGEHDLDEPTPLGAQAWSCRPDPFSSYRAGFEIRTYRLCRRILMFHHFPAEPGVGPDCLVRSTELTYRSSPIGSFVTAVQQHGFRRQGSGYVRRSLPPLELEYSEAIVQQAVQSVDEDSAENVPAGVDGSLHRWVDLDGEGLAGVLTEQAEGWFYKRNLSPLATGNGSGSACLASVALVAERPSLARLGGGRQQLLDLAGDGQLDLVELGEPVPGFYERAADDGWQDFVPFESLPNLDWSDPSVRLVDLTGDGRADVLLADDEAFTWFPSLAEAGFAPAERVALAPDEERGPRVVFDDDRESIQLADLSGDGLTDIVRIRNGEVSYWPNLGYGRFGARVEMDDAPFFDPPDVFNPKRIRLADIDGSGVTDLVYLGHGGVQLYFNESGNGWSGVRRLTDLPVVDDVASVQVTDVLGNGTACLVWSSPLPGDVRSPLRYVDLMGGQKPHLLVGVRNNLGAETRVEYAPSTRFYLEDRQAGRPWVTRLPFPVHVVERAETIDRISGNRFVTRYAYHHGYFDGEEREFRGFGLVEQWDTERFDVFAAPAGAGTNADEATHVPPVCTRTWFHTGAFLDQAALSRQFEHEYYREDVPAAERMLLADTVFPQTIRVAEQRVPYTLSLQEQREAARALKGSILRQETYGLDDSEAASRPYSVSERNYTLEALQPRGGNPHGTFFVHPRETIDFHYDRVLYDVAGSVLADPRVTHTLTLDVDEFGNVLRSIDVAYGRRYGDADPVLTAADRNRQVQTLLTYTETDYTEQVDDPDAYRAPLVCDTRTYELLGAAPSASAADVTNLFTFYDLLRKGGILETVGDGKHDLAYEDLTGAGATTAGPYRRLLEHVRVLYRRDDLSGPLALGDLQPRALPFESYRLAFPATLLASVYRRRAGGVVEDLMPNPSADMAAAGYLRGKALKTMGAWPVSTPDDDWWLPSGRTFLSADPNHTASQELAEAQAHFYVPRRFRDPFGAVTTVDYDGYDLLLQQTRDALGNTITAGQRSVAGALTANGNDYRVLQPRRVMDANRNRAEVVFDALGLVTATAAMGKPGQQLGDSVQAVTPDLADTVVSSHLLDPLHDPYEVLQGATTRLLYDLFAYARTRDDPEPQPVVVYTLVRETHQSDLAPTEQTRVLHSFSYSDGFAREIQRKVQAEPASNGAPQWVGTGWTIFNNKGKAVRQYEPFFSPTHRFELANTVGVSTILLYDPVGRVRATLHPNHTYEKIVVDPWRQQRWDVNDTVATLQPETDLDVGALIGRLPQTEYRPTWLSRMQGSADANERATAAAAVVHADTPTTSWFDALGRPFLTVAHNRLKRSGSPVEERHRTVLQVDIEGNQRQVVDARDRVVARSDFDMLGNRLHTASMEAGERWILEDVLGNTVLAWDTRGHRFATDYDALRRPTEVRLRDGTAPDVVVQRMIYGESRPNPEASNLRARILRVLDAAGQLTTDDYDFKGAPTRSTRKLALAYRSRPDWSMAVPLESEAFVNTTRYDALGRPCEMTMPNGSVFQLSYNEASLLEALAGNVRGSPTVTSFVRDIDYDAKGRRTRIAYGNGAETTYDYDPETFRLIRLSTSRGTTVLQDLRYTHDPVGNVTHVSDDAQQTIFFNNRLVDPTADYTYDALYRLIDASGREHLGQVGGGQVLPSAPGSHPGDGNAMGRYIERYTYDEVGNILELYHASQDPTTSPWKRSYAYDEQSLLEPTRKSNRLTSTTIGTGAPEPYAYDLHGNVTFMPHLPLMRWDDRDGLEATSQQKVTGGTTPQTTYYIYDAAGLRVRKVTDRQAAAGATPKRMKERIYLGAFEVYREYDATGTSVALERETLHVEDGSERVALSETRTAGTDPAPAQLLRYQIANHLGSSILELDGTAQIISYEEYYPYGGTSYQAVRSQTETPKRYRYTGKERDEESGFYYHGARYYAPWLARWTAADPAGLGGGINVYAYAACSPCRLIDRSGAAPEEDSIPDAGSRPNVPSDAPQDTARATAEPVSRATFASTQIALSERAFLSLRQILDNPGDIQFEPLSSFELTEDTPSGRASVTLLNYGILHLNTASKSADQFYEQLKDLAKADAKLLILEPEDFGKLTRDKLEATAPDAGAPSPADAGPTSSDLRALVREAAVESAPFEGITLAAASLPNAGRLTSTFSEWSIIGLRNFHDQKALAHELFGHYWLLAHRLPWRHGESLSTEKAPGGPFTGTVDAFIEERIIGRLPHSIRDFEQRLYEKSALDEQLQGRPRPSVIVGPPPPPQDKSKKRPILLMPPLR